MKKYAMLGTANILLLLWMGVGFIANLVSVTSFEQLKSLLIFCVIEGVFLGYNTYLAFHLLFQKKHPLPFHLYLILTCLPLMYFALLILASASFIVTSPLFIIALIGLTALLFFLFKASSMKVAVGVTLISIMVFSFIVATSFEETYCWQKGEKADPLGSKMVQVTQRDEQEVKTSIPVGGQIGLAWKTHLLCHAHFNTVNAVKESFVLKK